ncbi:MAG TPA: class I SAM-dependent methyltransferase [Fibrobacteria bacterium]|nr:class I SAM-dependent methyltransferase [Fibrobacteria bacterium]
MSEGKTGIDIGHAFNEQRYGDTDRAAQGIEGDDRIRLMLALVRGLAAPGRKILDVGCTDGFLSRAFKGMGLYAIGVDASASAVAVAKTVCDEAYAAELGSKPLPLADSSMDLIWAGEVIEHIFDTEFFVEDLRRVLKPGGTLILSTPNLAAWLNRISLLLGQQPFFTEVGVRASNSGNFLRKVSQPAGHIRNFTPSSLRHLIRACGLTVESLKGASILSGRGMGAFDRLIARTLPGLASDLVIVCRK